MEFIPVSLYEWMDKQGGISTTKEKKREYLSQASIIRHLQITRQIEKDNSEDNRNALSKFNKMKEAGCFEGDERKKLIDISKRMIVYDMMKS
jgi:hypothetical protein